MSKYLSAPNAVIWDVTHRCNLNCRHCYVDANAKNTVEPSTEEAKAIIDQLRKAKVFRLSFSGGEPLLREDVYELAEYGSQFFPIEIATNGLLLTGEAAQKLKDAGVSIIQMSMDGLEDAHDYLRGRKGAFKKMVEATRILKEVGIPFGLTTVIYKKNASHIKELIEKAESLGAFTIRFYRLIHTGRGEDLSPLDVTPSEYKKALEKVYNNTGKIHAVADEAFGFLLHGRESPHQWVGCQAGRTIAGIKANGQVVPCPMFEDPVFYCGKVPDNDFADIWKMSPVLTEFRSLENIHGKCSSCQYLYQCGGGCRAAVYAKTGDLYSSDYQCFIDVEEEP
jgi:radical SAM protein with 4Fe4S-binding SPASM domain